MYVKVKVTDCQIVHGQTIFYDDREWTIEDDYDSGLELVDADGNQRYVQYDQINADQFFGDGETLLYIS